MSFDFVSAKGFFAATVSFSDEEAFLGFTLSSFFISQDPSSLDSALAVGWQMVVDDVELIVDLIAASTELSLKNNSKFFGLQHKLKTRGSGNALRDAST